jgi:integrase/recombinase XerD
LGLRPFEIVKIRLNDISFAKRELTLEVRKEDNPMTLPVPEPAIKAIAVYIMKGRPKSSRRTLFLTRCAPHRPMRPNSAGCCIRDCMRRVNIPAPHTGYGTPMLRISFKAASRYLRSWR